MDAGTYLSGVGHGAVIVWALVGGFSLRADDPLPSPASEVTLISSAEFAALILPDTAPEVADDQPTILPLVPESDAPEVTTSSDAAPDRPQPAEVVDPTPEIAPVAPPADPAQFVDEADDGPTLLSPPPTDDSALETKKPDEVAKPAPAPRVAPISASAPAPDTEIADQITPQAEPDKNPDAPTEISTASAPEQAATEIVTEAEVPVSVAPAASARPTARPRRPTAAEPKPTSDAIADAVAAQVSKPSRPAAAVPTGPPLTGSEKDSLRLAVRKCWVVDVGSVAANITVTVGFSLSKTGNVVPGSLRLLGSVGGQGRALETAYAAASRAILRCQRGGYILPSEKYSRWQDIEITFNPENMRIK